MPVAYVALGSNLGDKKAYLEDALSRMKVHGIKVQKVSTWIDPHQLHKPCDAGITGPQGIVQHSPDLPQQGQDPVFLFSFFHLRISYRPLTMFFK